MGAVGPHDGDVADVDEDGCDMFIGGENSSLRGGVGPIRFDGPFSAPTTGPAPYTVYESDTDRGVRAWHHRGHSLKSAPAIASEGPLRPPAGGRAPVRPRVPQVGAGRPSVGAATKTQNGCPAGSAYT